MQFLLISKQEQREQADEFYRTAVNIMFTQISAKQGVKHFKEQAVASIVKEYKKLRYMNTFVRVCSEYLTQKQKRDALRANTLIKEKRSGKNKGRACADGRPQRSYITK